ncbi:penicillin-insensitive murein endopeptidase [Pseudobacteriovorax antillogorgiicola]|uniref:Penicillin-insensitive murein endopeptidase n=1 Tax=Pseudobacteriovorax antillogorgiicola TaxID=1513793 RepID=A0A1Y6CHI0_9BACT|nr:penicillin-insensitive murein endopeptidase [Pseudobacteriovorax antillogorgiicola]TCS46962.1 penicillin-insensitive murein endopeptidase [Pseudobacteriovorax antillogorgiicola]SMF64565.1 Penicillin-insensitive murein endopeptidase [Pseudobacteriovorax antillogorgiicola]
MKLKLLGMILLILNVSCGSSESDSTDDQYYSFIQLPSAGLGYYTMTTSDKLYGDPSLIMGLQQAGQRWHSSGNARSFGRMGINDISYFDGSPVPGHSSHRTGKDVDMRPVRGDGQERAVTVDSAAYSSRLNATLIRRYLDPNLGVRIILFNDPEIFGSRQNTTSCPFPYRSGLQLNYVKCWVGHHNHLHVSVR